MGHGIPRLPALVPRPASSNETQESTAFAGSRSPDLAAPRPFTSLQRPLTETTATRRKQQRAFDLDSARPLSDVSAQLERAEPGSVGISIGDLGLAEARARVEAALYMLDHTYDPPVSEDLRPMRALLDARMRRLPDGFELPDDGEVIAPEQREALLADFLTSPEGRRWHGDEDAEEVARMAIDFGAGYNHGGPLRWSPVVIEIFMTSWLARKVTADPQLFARVPKVLPDWVRYAGRRNGVPAAPLREAIAAVEQNEAEMLAAIEDPGAWGPAKTIAVAALEAGVDLTDETEVARFIQRYNDGLAA